MTSPNIHFQFLLIPSSDTHGRPAIGEKFHFEQARAAQERFDWGRGPRLPPRRVLEACGEAPLSRDCSQGTIKTTFKSIADPPGLEQLLHAQHPTAAAADVQRLASQHRDSAVLLQKALQVLVWVMTAVRQEAFDLLLLVVALCAEDTRLQAAGQPPNPERFRGQSSIAEGFRRQRQRACGSDQPHHVTNDAAQRALRGFPDLNQRVMEDCITAVTTSEHHQEVQHSDQRAGRDPHSHNLAQYVYGHVFQVHRSEDRVGPPRSVTGLTSVVHQLARQMETNVGVHLATNLFRWLKTRCRVQLHRTLHPEAAAAAPDAGAGGGGGGGGAYGGDGMGVDQAAAAAPDAGAGGGAGVELPRQQQTIVLALAAAIARDEPLCAYPDAAAALQSQPDVLQELELWVQQEQDRWRPRGLLVPGCSFKRHSLPHGERYLAWAAEVLHEIEQHRSQLRARGVPEAEVARHFPVFGLLPEPSYQQVHIGLGQEAVKELLVHRDHFASEHHLIPPAAVPTGLRRAARSGGQRQRRRRGRGGSGGGSTAAGSGGSAAGSGGSGGGAAGSGGSGGGAAGSGGGSGGGGADQPLRWGPKGGKFRNIPACFKEWVADHGLDPGDVWAAAGLRLGISQHEHRGSKFDGFVTTDAFDMCLTMRRRYHSSWDEAKEAGKQVRVSEEELLRLSLRGVDPGCSPIYWTCAMRWPWLPAWVVALLGVDLVLRLPEVRNGSCPVRWPDDLTKDQQAAAEAQLAAHLTASKAAAARDTIVTRTQAADRATAAASTAAARWAKEVQAAPQQGRPELVPPRPLALMVAQSAEHSKAAAVAAADAAAREAADAANGVAREATMSALVQGFRRYVEVMAAAHCAMLQLHRCLQQQQQQQQLAARVWDIAFTHCSGAEHRTNCGYAQHQRWQQWRVKADPALCAWQSSLPTARTVDVQNVLGRLDYKYGGSTGAGGQQGEAVVRELGFVDLLARYAAPAWRQKRLQVYCQKQRVLCREAVRLMGGEPEVTQQNGVVGWGGGSAGFHGTVSRADQPPRKGFVRLLRERFARHVIMINEYRTSMVCANCGRLSLRRKEPPQGGADFRVLVCNDCHTTWDRDENAALNMRLLLVLQLLGRDRPAVFCRPEGGVD
ncbi:hypothetical protein CHLRE_10g442900v5 [Chlamydomonas reinhardtii]|uniref:Cas12f1-like TNB domain-containing protein n=1 Tax=Chlamydomonas reinhardtii TaxID=3055 RepID=A0A2K3DAM6_CHLRE|nr:uncharacterized protein CHLRE_10g442900v5 [Chlamydomonas reinhardtii]PNW77581.1 hypothetical protein CHLRE_10g442900v5 [Chlamydomonas reinhardtii]